MRTELRWTLLATLLLSGWALWSGRGNAPASTVAQVEPPSESGGVYRMQSTGHDRLTLPVRLERDVMEPAKRDPFAPAAAPAPALAEVKPFVLVGPDLPPPPPPPPALSYRYLGQMRTPGGERLVYLSKGVDTTPIAVGTRLDEGYVVEGISSEAILLRYPPLDTKAMIPIPQGESQ